MSSTSPNVNVLEQCRVAPPAGNTVDELSLPLTFYDTFWWLFHSMHDVLLYEFPHPKTHFVDTVIPQFKESISLTLKHFLPLAGNLLYPSDSSGKLEFRYVEGDSIPVTFAESSDDFSYLVGNHERDVKRYHPLVPELPQASVASGVTRTPVFAVQVTLFPNSGICVGWRISHVLADANTIRGILNAWASFSKFSGDAELLASGSLPFFDRAVIEDPFDLDTMIFNWLKALKSQFQAMESSPDTPVTASTVPNDKVRATFEISSSDIQKLKNSVLAKRPNLVHLSTFTVICAYIWICWLKSADAVADDEAKVDANEEEIFICAADCRARFDPPIPRTYFGNCVVPCIAKSAHAELVGSEGLANAAVSIRDAIQERVNDKDAILRGNWISEIQRIAQLGLRPFSAAGSPKFEINSVDFGWGKPAKYESTAIDDTDAASIYKSIKSEGSLEISLVLPKKRMEAFAAAFSNDLRIL